MPTARKIAHEILDALMPVLLSRFVRQNRAATTSTASQFVLPLRAGVCQAIQLDPSAASKAELDEAPRAYCAPETEAMETLQAFLSGEVKNSFKN